jgi:hypothetical protein
VNRKKRHGIENRAASPGHCRNANYGWGLRVKWRMASQVWKSRRGNDALEGVFKRPYDPDTFQTRETSLNWPKRKGL